jgi:beta-lactamase regulating signal transducer with metallopeptidase domain
MNSSIIAAFVINAAWQIPVIAIVASLAARAMRRTPARQQNLVWIAALVVSVALPIWSAMPRRVSISQSIGDGVRQAVMMPSNAPRVTLDALLSARPASTVIDVAKWLAIAWALFILYRLAVLAVAAMRARAILRSANADITGDVIARCGSLKVDARVVSSHAVLVPMTLGRTIILPHALLAQLTDDALVALVGHELAHIRRRDFVTNIIFELLTLPIAFHPVTFLLKRRVAETRELACDEQVTPALVSPRDYARALVDVAAFVSTARTPAYSLAMAGGDFEQRIRRIVRRGAIRHSRVLLVASWAALAVTSAAAAAVAIHPQLSIAPGFTNETPRFSDRVEGSASKLNSPDAQERAEAACKAGRARDESAIPALVAMLGDDATINAIQCYGGSHNWSPAMQSLVHPSPGEQAALALASISRPSYDSLLTSLNSKSLVARRNAAWAIGEMRGGFFVDRDSAVLPVIRLLTDSDATVRRAAAWCLSEFRSREAIEPLIVALSDIDASVRGTAAFALGETKTRDATMALSRSVITDTDPEVRKTSAWALGEIADSRAIDALTEALRDPNVASAARHALSEISDRND